MPGLAKTGGDPGKLCSYLLATQSPSVTTCNPPLGQQSAPDSSRSLNLIDQDITKELQIPCMKYPIRLQIQALDVCHIGSCQVEYPNKPILLLAGVNHSETLSFLLITGP